MKGNINQNTNTNKTKQKGLGPEGKDIAHIYLKIKGKFLSVLICPCDPTIFPICIHFTFCRLLTMNPQSLGNSDHIAI
jgi:hypothetical protein